MYKFFRIKAIIGNKCCTLKYKEWRSRKCWRTNNSRAWWDDKIWL